MYSIFKAMTCSLFSTDTDPDFRLLPLDAFGAERIVGGVPGDLRQKIAARGSHTSPLKRNKC